MQHPSLIILAAGGSQRMGRPKQLLPWKGSTLLRSTCQVALATSCQPVILVLGHEAQSCAREVSDLPILILENPQWQQGMGTSVALAIAELEKRNPEIPAALLMLADQPAVTAEFLNLVESAWHKDPQTIIATAYPEGGGVPALFPRSYFGELKTLTGDHGARVIIKRHADCGRTIKPDCEFYDLDTPEAYLSKTSP